MRIEKLAIPEVLLLWPARHMDSRGFFSETYNRAALAEAGVELDFVQDNHSRSAQAGTVRGLHLQGPPFAQAKLVRVIRGAIYDVAVDVRKSSPTYGKHVGATISAEDWNQILVPVGFAHGFMTLEPDTEVVYKTGNFYSREHEGGVLWNDPDVGIAWPSPGGAIALSEKDKVLPRLADFDSPFD